MPRPTWVIPRSARWNACECALARPGRVRPGSRVSPGARRPGCRRPGPPAVTAVNRSPAASISTSGQTPRPGSQASSACQARGAAGTARQRDRHRLVSSSSTAASAATPASQSARLGVLGGRVGHAGRVAHEQHRRRQPRGQDPGVVPGPGGQDRRGDPAAGQRLGQPRPQRRVELHQRRERLPAHADLHPLGLRGPPRGGLDLADHAVEHVLVGRPGVQPGVHRRADRVGRARLGDDLPERGQRAAARPPPAWLRAPRPRTGASGRGGRRAGWCPRGRPGR